MAKRRTRSSRKPPASSAENGLHRLETELDESLFLGWRKVGEKEDLSSDAEIVKFLVHLYETSRDVVRPTLCAACHIPLKLTCEKCQLSQHTGTSTRAAGCISAKPDTKSSPRLTASRMAPAPFTVRPSEEDAEEGDDGSYPWGDNSVEDDFESSAQVSFNHGVDDSSSHAHASFVANDTWAGKIESSTSGFFLNNSDEFLVDRAPKESEKKYVCKTCGYAVTRPSILRRHMRSHSETKTFKCSLCTKAFKHPETLKEHTYIHTGEKPHQCKICDQAFRKAAQLGMHMKTHVKRLQAAHRAKVAGNSELEHPAAKARPHMVRLTTDRPYKCQVCQESFRKLEDLKKHMRKKKHEGERAYACTQCSQSFTRGTDLNKHLRRHLDIRPHACSKCSMTFHNSNELKNHMTTHTGARPYVCDICHHGFTTSGCRLRHKRMVHKIWSSSTGQGTKSSEITAHGDIKSEDDAGSAGDGNINSTQNTSCRGSDDTPLPADLEAAGRSLLEKADGLVNATDTESSSAANDLEAGMGFSESGVKAEPEPSGSGFTLPPLSGQNKLGSSLAPLLNSSGQRELGSSLAPLLDSSNQGSLGSTLAPISEPSGQNNVSSTASAFSESSARKSSGTALVPFPHDLGSSSVGPENFSGSVTSAKMASTLTLPAENCNPTMTVKDSVSSLVSPEISGLVIVSNVSASTIISLENSGAVSDISKSAKLAPENSGPDQGPEFAGTSSVHSETGISKKKRKTQIICRYCVKVFTSFKAYSAHVKTHQEPKTYVCADCGEKFTNYKDYKYHKPKHESSRRHACGICGKKFLTPGAVRVHVRSHTGEKPYVCQLCGKGFVNSGGLTAHTATHMKIKPFICEVCGASFPARHRLKIHSHTHTGERPYACSLCPSRFAQSVDLKRHMCRHTGERAYVCEICSRSFTVSSALRRHKLKHSDIRPFACEICTSTFKSRRDLKNHVENVHTPKDPEVQHRYRCTHCEYTCPSTSRLKLHMRSHTAEKPYQCPDCNASFRYPNVLARHQRCHQANKPFLCSFCNASFDRQAHLTIHMKNHPTPQ